MSSRAINDLSVRNYQASSQGANESNDFTSPPKNQEQRPAMSVLQAGAASPKDNQQEMVMEAVRKLKTMLSQILSFLTQDKDEQKPSASSIPQVAGAPEIASGAPSNDNSAPVNNQSNLALPPASPATFYSARNWCPQKRTCPWPYAFTYSRRSRTRWAAPSR